MAQSLFDTFKEDVLLELVQWCRKVYCRAVVMEDSVLRQRAKLRWLKYGDRCSTVFFRQINRTRVKLRVFQITNAAGDTITEADQVAAEFISYYEALLGGPMGSPRHFSKQLGMNGADVCAAISEFFVSGRILKQINATLLVLIPKVQLPTRVSEFRPIACCNVMYKAIAKILVKRMKLVLHSLIDYSQNAFVPGRFTGSPARRPNLTVSLRAVMEILHVLLRLRIQPEGAFHYHWKCSVLGIINLCFADDVLIFCAGDISSVRLITEVLEEFARLSGLRINPSKSTIILSKSVQRDRQNILNLVWLPRGQSAHQISGGTFDGFTTYGG
ncbi:UNVERIFIED_CONTAM: hypothetical protein Sradi_7039900 [Sesamum radiatum]|uniref:Reverse transcriptase domain-containing protein n=1 Tax=Sesamum radiatum TaxID=300843 RepID=A0AAW2J9A3_SESRA